MLNPGYLATCCIIWLGHRDVVQENALRCAPGPCPHSLLQLLETPRAKWRKAHECRSEMNAEGPPPSAPRSTLRIRARETQPARAPRRYRIPSSARRSAHPRALRRMWWVIRATGPIGARFDAHALLVVEIVADGPRAATRDDSAAPGLANADPRPLSIHVCRALPKRRQFGYRHGWPSISAENSSSIIAIPP